MSAGKRLLFVCAALAGACGGATQDPIDPPGVVSLTVTPAAVTLGPGQSQQFSAAGRQGTSSVPVNATFVSEGGGTITPTGLFTAGQTGGTYRVIASATLRCRRDRRHRAGDDRTATASPSRNGGRSCGTSRSLRSAQGRRRLHGAQCAEPAGRSQLRRSGDGGAGVEGDECVGADGGRGRALVLGGAGADQPGVGGGQAHVVRAGGERLPGGLHAGRGVLQLAAGALGDEDADVLEEPGDAAARVRGGGEPVAAVRHGDQHVRGYRPVPGGLQHHGLAAAGQG